MRNSTSDETLISRINKGDQQAFLTLYDRYSARVYALAIRILEEKMLAEEITQDTFMKVWNRGSQYDPKRGKFLTWLLTVTRTTALDRLRFEQRRPTLSTAVDPDDTFSSIPNTTFPEDEKQKSSLFFAVQSLPEDQRQAIELAYYKGLSQSEIAEMLDWPLGTVKTRIRSGMIALRRIWLEDDLHEI